MVIIGGHAGNGPKIGDVDFGAASKIDEDEVTSHWYEYLFKGAHNEFASRQARENFRDGRKPVARRR